MKARIRAVGGRSLRSTSASGTPRSSRQSLRDTAYEAIKRRIMTCAFRPGESINEVQVASLIGVGRTPVHQALDRLMLEDMVEVIPRKGVIVKPVSLHDVMQMVEVRLINETYCARLAAERAEDKHISEMQQIFADAQKAISAQNVRELMLLDGRFHHAFASAARNDELVKILRILNERALRFWFISFTTPDHHESFQRQHGAILDAIRRRDSGAAEDAVRTNIEAFRASVARHL
jgi:GntR family transcriptional regulator, rspAB operon transcriptional repressor